MLHIPATQPIPNTDISGVVWLDPRGEVRYQLTSEPMPARVYKDERDGWPPFTLTPKTFYASSYLACRDADPAHKQPTLEKWLRDQYWAAKKSKVGAA